MLDGAAVFLEKLPSFALKSGLVLAFVGAGLQGGLGLTIIQTDAVDGYVAEIAPVLWITGTMMVLAAAFIKLLTWLAAFRKVPERWSQIRRTRRRLTGNIGFLDDETRLVLLHILRMPEGRIECLGRTPVFQRLYEMELIVPERPGHFLGKTVPVGMMRTAPEIYSNRELMIRSLTASLNARYGCDVLDERRALDIIQKAEEKRQNDCESGSF